ncbi:hypothetical protein CHELA1G11_13666 [Hyphomicrobiales bacterium]|nr:hypothetical protein CHELA1G2_10649 [Hyphomicrobiales bacterium]CAH1653702.1 hypothetical protein CHELA1G2_10656 [Hyphomicrobiales bacterium]CAH1654876.1 hypothetical protein CHELA1G11_10848 [Hyphomicrobiales bacterium]CAH1671844.1 hypothetical protein CHELA1G2_13461 [Hyphomicrobiales bacterium]CAH1673177.1 hypothetical protein CHELA1G11_13657 [Hyphomicrobiales bacterium]
MSLRSLRVHGVGWAFGSGWLCGFGEAIEDMDVATFYLLEVHLITPWGNWCETSVKI